jgi:hypothetical protein
MPKLTMRDAEFIRVFAEFGYKPVPLAKEYKVHPDSVRNILLGKNFKPGSDVPRVNAHRKLADDQVRRIKQLAAEGHGEHHIWNAMDRVVGRSTVRQVMNGVTYQDVV